MDEQMIALGRRAVACKGWRWPKDRAPMLAKFAEGDWEETSDWLHRLKQNSEGDWVLRSGVVVVPNLSHPFMVGWLLALLEEVYGGLVWLEPSRNGWQVRLYDPEPAAVRVIADPRQREMASHAVMRAEALVAALEAAP